MTLPVAEPIIKTYPIFANALSVILLDKNSESWLNNNFIQLICNNNEALSFYDFDYRNCPYLVVEKLSKEFITSLNIPIEKFIVKALQSNKYVYLNVNPKHIKAYKYWMNSSHHDMFIYGYTEEEKLFYIADCFELGKYTYNICTYEELLKSLNNMNTEDELFLNFNGCVEFLSLNVNAKHFTQNSFDILRVNDSIRDYLNGSCTCLWNVQDFKWNYGKTNHKFGVNCYEYIHHKIDILPKELTIADYHIIWEHKLHLLRIVTYLIKNNFLIDDFLIIEKLTTIKKKALCARNLVIKFYLVRDVKYITKLHLLYHEIEAQEKEVLKELLAKIQLQSVK